MQTFRDLFNDEFITKIPNELYPAFRRYKWYMVAIFRYPKKMGIDILTPKEGYFYSLKKVDDHVLLVTTGYLSTDMWTDNNKAYKAVFNERDGIYFDTLYVASTKNISVYFFNNENGGHTSLLAPILTTYLKNVEFGVHVLKEENLIKDNIYVRFGRLPEGSKEFLYISQLTIYRTGKKISHKQLISLIDTLLQLCIPLPKQG